VELRFAEARAVEALARRIEAALRSAPRAILDGRTNAEALVAQAAVIRTLTEQLDAEVASLEKLFAL
jgi:hypothetical protein